MATFKIVFRPSAKEGKHQGTLSLRVVHDRKPKTASIKCFLFIEEWDEVTQTIIYPADDLGRTHYLEGVQKQITVCVGKMNGVIKKMDKQNAYTVTDVIDRYRMATDDGKLMGFAAILAEELMKNGQQRTSKAYLTVCRGLIAFHGGRDIPLSQINASLMKSFETHLKSKGIQPNTSSYYMRNLRTIYNKAAAAGIIIKTENPFEGVFTGVEETKKRALSIEEANKLKSIDLDAMLEQHQSGTKQHQHLNNLKQAKLLFLFCLYSHGMCFVDMCHLKKSNIKDGVIRYYRKKTGKQIEVPFNNGMRKIIKHFSQETKDSEYVFPIIKKGGDAFLFYETALRTQNRRLKKLAKMAGLDKTIATHVARHSWASILKNKKQPLSVISEGLGHSSEKMTRKYLTSFDHSVLGRAGNIVFTAISRPPGRAAVLS